MANEVEQIIGYSLVGLLFILSVVSCCFPPPLTYPPPLEADRGANPQEGSEHEVISIRP